jgi:hypothetical protein
MDLVRLVERAIVVLEQDGHIFQAKHAATLTAMAGRETIERDFLETVFAKYGALDALDAASRAKLARELHRTLRRFANSARRAHLAEWQQRAGIKELRRRLDEPNNNVKTPVLAAVAAAKGLSTTGTADEEADYLAKLRSLRFLNCGVVRATDRFVLHNIGSIYNEQYSYLGAGGDGYRQNGRHALLYQVNATSATVSPRAAGVASVPPPGYRNNSWLANATLCSGCDRPGPGPGPVGGIPGVGSYAACAELCGADAACRAWVWAPARQKTCYFKIVVSKPVPKAGDFSGCSPSYSPGDCAHSVPPPPPPPPPPAAVLTAPLAMGRRVIQTPLSISCMGNHE